jgi:hypothetical protein
METLNAASNLNLQSQKREETIMKRLNRVYKSLLLLSLAMAPSAAFAQAPLINGAKTQADVQINAVNNWNVLLGPVPMQIPGGAVYHCEVTCTSTVNNPHSAAADQDYFYAAFNNNAAANPTVNDGCVRRFDFQQDVAGIDNLDHLVVASTCFIPNLAGNQFFYCLGRMEPGQMNTFVDSTSMHVICIDDRQALGGAAASEQ